MISGAPVVCSMRFGQTVQVNGDAEKPMQSPGILAPVNLLSALESMQKAKSI